MTDAHALLQRCHTLGVTLTPLPGDKFKVRPAKALPDELKAELQRHKLEILALLTAQPALPWPCEHCGQPAEIEAVEPRKLDGVLLTFWHCDPCQTWAVTPATLREPPVWVRKTVQ